MSDRHPDNTPLMNDVRGREADENADLESSRGETHGKAGLEHREPDETGAPSKRRPVVLLGGIVLIALLIGGVTYYWLTTRNIESTDDAYTDGHAVSIAPQ